MNRAPTIFLAFHFEYTRRILAICPNRLERCIPIYPSAIISPKRAQNSPMAP